MLHTNGLPVLLHSRFEPRDSVDGVLGRAWALQVPVVEAEVHGRTFYDLLEGLALGLVGLLDGSRDRGVSTDSSGVLMVQDRGSCGCCYAVTSVRSEVNS